MKMIQLLTLSSSASFACFFLPWTFSQAKVAFNNLSRKKLGNAFQVETHWTPSFHDLSVNTDGDVPSRWRYHVLAFLDQVPVDLLLRCDVVSLSNYPCLFQAVVFYHVS